MARTMAQTRAVFPDYPPVMAVHFAMVMRMASQCRPGVPFASFEPQIESVAPDMRLYFTNGNIGPNGDGTFRNDFEWAYHF